MSVLCVIQARLGSTRFPRKVLSLLEGEPLIRHVVRRAACIPSVDDVVVTTPMKDMKEIADAIQIGHTAVVGYPGDENDVLARYASVVAPRPHDTVVRITSDCPLLDPLIAEGVIRLYQDTDGCQYAWNVYPGYVDGTDVEVFDRELLLEAFREATDPEDREHVTSWIRRRTTVAVMPPMDKHKGWLLKTSIDTHADLRRVRKLMKEGA